MAQVPKELERFCAEEYRRVLGTLVLVTGSKEMAADLTQEAFVRVCRDWDRVRLFDAPGAWVHRVALNLATSRLRRLGTEVRPLTRLGGRRVHHDELPDFAPEVSEALASLPAEERVVLVLRFFDDMPVEDVAGLLEIPEGTVKSRTRRGLALLRARGLIGPGDADE